jgi:hypothetical protein
MSTWPVGRWMCTIDPSRLFAKGEQEAGTVVKESGYTGPLPAADVTMKDWKARYDLCSFMLCWLSG